MADHKKITIAGAGRVGSMTALWCFLKELGDVVLWNRTADTAKGIALDILEASPLLESDVNFVGTNTFSSTKNSDVVVITAGAQRTEGMSREDLLLTNARIVRDIVKNVAKYNKDAVLMVVSNPLDAMVHVAKAASTYPRTRVVGMAGILDSSRFKNFIAKELRVGVEEVSALVLGSHGDAMIPLPQHASVNGIPLTELLPKRTIHRLVERTRNAGAEVIQLEKSSAFFSPSASATEMIESVVKDKKRVLPCAAYLNGEYGVKGIFMGVPVKLGARGVEEILEVKLTLEEKKQFLAAAQGVRNLVAQLRGVHYGR